MACIPDHPGANHYYIHAAEASNQPGRAGQAERLETLVPGAGHLVHMPAHIYIRTGQYACSAKSNADAAARGDEGYFKVAGPSRACTPRRCTTATTCSSSRRRRCSPAASPRRARPPGRPSRWSSPSAMRHRCWNPTRCRTARCCCDSDAPDEVLALKAPAAHAHRADRALSLHAGRGPTPGRARSRTPTREQQALTAATARWWQRT